MNWFKLVKLFPDLIKLQKQFGQKEWYKSKTIWFNSISFLSAVIFTITGDGLGAEQIATISVGLWTIVNIGLRFITLRPVDFDGFFSSKTILINGLVALSAITGLVFGDAGSISGNDISYISSAFIAVSNIILRFTTNNGIGLQSKISKGFD